MKKSLLSIASIAVLTLSSVAASGQVSLTAQARGGSDPRPQARGGSDPRPQAVSSPISSFGLLVSVVMSYLGL